MKTHFAAAALLCGLVSISHAASVATVGETAPAFSAQNTAGKTVNLADYKGKYVVLEWTSPACPFVQKHYNSGNMPALQKEAAGKGVAWVAIDSSAPGANKFTDPKVLDAWMKEKGATTNAVLMDPDGKIGQSYAAKTTPHMYIIDPQGKLVYAGAIDSKATSDPEDIKTADNYVRLALNETTSGKPVSKAVTRPYGCSVKYAK
jgi:AhpC/TSA family